MMIIIIKLGFLNNMKSLQQIHLISYQNSNSKRKENKKKANSSAN